MPISSVLVLLYQFSKIQHSLLTFYRQHSEEKKKDLEIAINMIFLKVIVNTILVAQISKHSKLRTHYNVGEIKCNLNARC